MNLKNRKTNAYSLRNRQKQKSTNNKKPIKAKTSRKYKVEKKFKSEPLSKYRRKNANARERIRMKDINDAYENLRNCVPIAKDSENENLSSEQLTKITTLKLAMNHITALSELLAQTDYLAKASDSIKFNKNRCYSIEIDHSYSSLCESIEDISDNQKFYDEYESNDENNDLIEFNKITRFAKKSNSNSIDSESFLKLNLNNLEISKPYVIPLETESNLNPLMDLFSEICELAGNENLISF